MRRFIPASRLTAPVCAMRALHLHEGISKQLLADYGCTVQRGVICDNVDEACEACTKLPGPTRVVKAQILAGGRGKGTFDTGFQGGVHLCASTEEVTNAAREMLGHRLITKQTTKDGLLVTKVLVAECLEIEHEYYVSLLLDRSCGGPVFVASVEGGMDIETVAEKTPEKIVKMPVPVSTGMTEAMGAELAQKLGMPASTGSEFVRLYNFAKESDALMVEVNPMARTGENSFAMIDAKINFDDNAAYRQRSIWEHEDKHQMDPREAEAAKWDLNYVGLDGNVGCLVNGAGLAMATMDMISMYGGSPANFLDVGGSAKADQVAAALDIIQQDSRVEAILINIFAGIMKCDTIAQGVIDACRRVEMRVPFVVRLAGTNAEVAQKMLVDSGLPLTTAVDLDDAASKVMELVKKK